MAVYAKMAKRFPSENILAALDNVESCFTSSYFMCLCLCTASGNDQDWDIDLDSIFMPHVIPYANFL